MRRYIFVNTCRNGNCRRYLLKIIGWLQRRLRAAQRVSRVAQRSRCVCRKKSIFERIAYCHVGMAQGDVAVVRSYVYKQWPSRSIAEKKISMFYRRSGTTRARSSPSCLLVFRFPQIIFEIISDTNRVYKLILERERENQAWKL